MIDKEQYVKIAEAQPFVNINVLNIIVRNVKVLPFVTTIKEEAVVLIVKVVVFVNMINLNQDV